jgi:hypothetical protein
MLSHTLCSCVGCNACRNTSTSSSEEDKTTLSTDSSRTVCDTTSAASDAEALELATLLSATDVETLAELLTATDVEDEQEEDDEYLSLQFSFFPFAGDLLKSSHTFLSFVNVSCFSLSEFTFCCFAVLSLLSYIVQVFLLPRVPGVPSYFENRSFPQW